MDIKRKKTGNDTASVVNGWEYGYYSNILKKEKYQVDSEKVKEYFEINNVMDGLFSITMYSYGFIMEDAERLSDDDYQAGKDIYVRALKLFERGKSYGLHGIQLKYPNFDELINSETNPFEKDDIPSLYWLSAAIGGSISASGAAPAYVVDLPKLGWLLESAFELEPDWNNGALYSAMISYTMSRPDAIENREQIARDYFKKAVQVSQGNDSSIYVRFAESVSINNQNRVEFEELLNTVLSFDIDSAPKQRLSNALAQNRAKWLLERIDELFY